MLKLCILIESDKYLFGSFPLIKMIIKFISWEKPDLYKIIFLLILVKHEEI